jgi:hypothetical protein
VWKSRPTCLHLTSVCCRFIGCVLEAKVVNKPINGSVAFVNDGDVYISSVIWKTIVNFDLAGYEAVITSLLEYKKASQEITERATPGGNTIEIVRS